MRRTRLATLAGAIAAAIAGCDAITGPAGADLLLHIADTGVGSSGAFVIEFSVENRGKDTAYITPRCGDSLRPVVYVRQGSDWVRAGGGFCTTNMAMHPWPLQSGGRLFGSIEWDDAGTYQLRIEAADREGEESVWIPSTAFRLE